MTKQYWVYILASKRNGTIYTGVTSNLPRRLYEHKSKHLQGFTAKYNVTKLVYFEQFDDPKTAIMIEKRIKGWTRLKKTKLIESVNPLWVDLDPSLRSG